MIADRSNARTRRLLVLNVFICALIGGPAQADFASGPRSLGNWYVAITVAGGGGVDETKIAADDEKCAFADDRLCSGENFEYGLVQFDLRVFTPQQTDIPGDPRFFVRGGLMRKFGKDVAVKVEPVSEDVFIASAKAEQADFIWDAGLGIAFPFTLRERSLQFEVSVSYGQEPIEASGRWADDDAGSFKLKDELELDFIREMLEITGPVYTRGALQFHGVVGAYLQQTLSNQKSQQRRSNEVDFRYEKSLGFGAFAGVRVAFGRE